MTYVVCIIKHYRFHLYAESHLNDAVGRVNRDLEVIQQWSIENKLIFNAAKTQGIIISRRDLSNGGDFLRIGGNVIPSSIAVSTGSLVWAEMSPECTLRLLNRSKKYMTQDLRLYLMRTLVISIFLYSEVVYFPSLTGVAYRRLELAFNVCTGYVYDLRHFDHISPFETLCYYSL
jgi:hypothetical protein